MRLSSAVMNSSGEYDFDEEEYYFPPFIDVPSHRWQALAEASAVLALCFSSTASCLVALVSLSIGKLIVLDLYLLSLCVADLISSALVVPLSLAAKSGILSKEGHPACAVSGYLHVSLCAVRMYTFMWAAVDRYLAVRKPQRYDGIQTRTRSRCWLLFSWVMATCLCCPPLLGDSTARHFYHEGFLCLLDIGSILPYSITLCCLVLVPSVLTILYTYTYIFTTTDAHEGTQEDLDRNASYHVTTFLVTLEFVVLWTPWGVVSMLEHVSGKSVAGPTGHFWLLFFGETYIAWTPLTLIVTCRRCKEGFASLCTKSSSDVDV